MSAHLNTFEDMQWLHDTTGIDTRGFNYAELWGNEDCPTRVKLWRSDNPLYSHSPDRDYDYLPDHDKYQLCSDKGADTRRTYRRYHIIETDPYKLAERHGYKYIGDASLEYGGIFIDLSEWDYGYVNVVEVYGADDVHGGCVGIAIGSIPLPDTMEDERWKSAYMYCGYAEDGVTDSARKLFNRASVNDDSPDRDEARAWLAHTLYLAWGIDRDTRMTSDGYVDGDEYVVHDADWGVTDVGVPDHAVYIGENADLAGYVAATYLKR